MGRLGVPCHCVRCNTKYRARNRFSLSVLAWGLKGGWVALWLWAVVTTAGWWEDQWLAELAVIVVGFVGYDLVPRLAGWCWWASAEVRPVTTWTAETSFVDAGG